MASNLETATHLAGPLVNIDGRYIQRCVCCGEKLYDSHEIRNVGDSSFVEKTLVTVSENDYKIVGDERTKKLPQDFCIDLVEVAPCQSPPSR